MNEDGINLCWSEKGNLEDTICKVIKILTKIFMENCYFRKQLLFVFAQYKKFK